MLSADSRVSSFAEKKSVATSYDQKLSVNALGLSSSFIINKNIECFDLIMFVVCVE